MNDKTGSDAVDLQADAQAPDPSNQLADVKKTTKAKKPRKPRTSKAATRKDERDNSMGVLALKPILEGAILAAGEPLSLDRMQALFVDDYNAPNKGRLKEALTALQADCVSRGYELVEVASGWRFQVRNEYAQWVNRLWDEKPQKYSRALLETLALIAYRQPLTRGDIEEVRGVSVSSQTIKTLSERDWVKVIGHRDVPGRPALYATTRHFLDYFNLKSLEELPSLAELKDIDGLNQSLDLELTAVTLDEMDSGGVPEEQSIDNTRDVGVDGDVSATRGEDSLNVKKLNESSAEGRTNNE